MPRKPSSPEPGAAGAEDARSPGRPAPDYREVADCACFHARRAARIVTQEFDSALAAVDLKATQYTLLCALAGRPRGASAPPIVELAAELLVEPSALSRTVAVLARRGLVQLEPGRDRRQRGVSLTPEGRRVFRAGFPHWKRAQESVALRLGQVPFARALAALRELADGHPQR